MAMVEMPHGQRDPAAGDDAAEDVAAQIVGAEDMAERGRLKPVGHVDLERIEGRDPWGEEAAEDHQ